ncbi:phospholipid transport system transporter-binding protein [Bisgaardia hudsonensis]|uniref:Phospholipid transport system transporter-binding protein n=1 Tax=Bisgaardia hudsonensis TaxID=109472 RepID=A0A4R2N052_9PAST|nr:STAS domain-containing protein [Bisgaardia hudsonensis]QLB13339.1 hypothetical protein A6A11_06835 [Bisgaardia hudsonensis]TCP12740.1 phospholipid transport system transporter-binding protein [Bisgaardia hudsonensis]
MQNKESLHWELSQNNDNITIQLTGILSRDSLLAVWQEYSSPLSLLRFNDKHLLLDLSAVTRIDSAGFAFICELINKINSNVKSLEIISYPDQLMILADLFGLSSWIKPFLQSNGNFNGNSRN